MQRKKRQLIRFMRLTAALNCKVLQYFKIILISTHTFLFGVCFFDFLCMHSISGTFDPVLKKQMLHLTTAACIALHLISTDMLNGMWAQLRLQNNIHFISVVCSICQGQKNDALLPNVFPIQLWYSIFSSLLSCIHCLVTECSLMASEKRLNYWLSGMMTVPSESRLLLVTE